MLLAPTSKWVQVSLDFDEKAKSYDVAGATYATVVNSDHWRYRYLHSDVFARDPGVDGGAEAGDPDPDKAVLVFGGQSSGWTASSKGGLRYTFHVEAYEIDKKRHATSQHVLSGNTVSTYPPTQV